MQYVQGTCTNIVKCYIFILCLRWWCINTHNVQVAQKVRVIKKKKDMEKKMIETEVFYIYKDKKGKYWDPSERESEDLETEMEEEHFIQQNKPVEM